jgi:tRNA U34 5-methylaminomethyl-2-thiouridine-forming methyltransferase MnmC
MSEFIIVTLKSGTKSLRSLKRNETFHPTSGPISEATLLHVDQQRLLDRASKVPRFVIWDVGFGAAANVLAVIAALKGSRAEIEIHSFDLTTAPIEFAIEHADELGYTKGFEEPLRELLLQGKTEPRDGMKWNLHLRDFSHLIKSSEEHFSSPHAILYDPYSPATNPEMWTLQHFSHLRARVGDGTDCIFTNYTRSTAVRVALLLAGFFVGTGCVIGEKAETTVAATRLDLLESPLDTQWLMKRVSQSTNAAPLREAVYTKSEISEEDFRALELHAQFRL